MIGRSILTKPRKLPDALIYRPVGTNNFRMFSTKNGSFIGEMNLEKRKREMFINFLHIMPEHRRQGFGTKFLNFAQNMSYRMGMKGRLRTLSSPIGYDPHNPPHIFYRKFGFSMDDKKYLSRIDKAIKKKDQLPRDYHNPRYMYYDPNTKTGQKKNLFEKLKSLF